MRFRWSDNQECIIIYLVYYLSEVFHSFLLLETQVDDLMQSKDSIYAQTSHTTI